MDSSAWSDTLSGLLREAGPILALTGAGVSAESGLATFRGPDGLWEGRDPAEIATPEAFAADPAAVWRFYDWRRKQAAAAEPNPGHRALAAWQARAPGFRLVTQNVDGLHERAGSRDVLRLHGTLWRLRCTKTGAEFDDDRLDLGALPPRSPAGGLLRPAVVWFGEALDARVLDEAAELARAARLVLVAGTSSMVYPAAALPLLARRAGAWVVEINPQPTPISEEVDERIAGPSGVVLPLLARAAGIETGGEP